MYKDSPLQPEVTGWEGEEALGLQTSRRRLPSQGALNKHL